MAACHQFQDIMAALLAEIRARGPVAEDDTSIAAYLLRIKVRPNAGKASCRGPSPGWSYKYEAVVPPAVVSSGPRHPCMAVNAPWSSGSRQCLLQFACRLHCEGCDSLVLTSDGCTRCAHISERSGIAEDGLLVQEPATGQPLPDDWLLAEMGTIFFAGHDTAGHTISWVLCAFPTATLCCLSDAESSRR